MKKYILAVVIVVCLSGLWIFTEQKDYFKANYNDLTPAEEALFTGNESPARLYIANFGNSQFTFPRQYVDKIRLFRNTPIIQTLTARTLKQAYLSDVVTFFNDPTNFHWGETTWEPSEAQYILRLYNQEKVAGKVYIDLESKIIESRPFTPNVKFGTLTNEGAETLKRIIDDRQKWK